MFLPTPILGHRLPRAAVEGVAVWVECERTLSLWDSGASNDAILLYVKTNHMRNLGPKVRYPTRGPAQG